MPLPAVQICSAAPAGRIRPKHSARQAAIAPRATRSEEFFCLMMIPGRVVRRVFIGRCLRQEDKAFLVRGSLLWRGDQGESGKLKAESGSGEAGGREILDSEFLILDGERKLAVVREEKAKSEKLKVEKAGRVAGSWLLICSDF